MTVKDNRVRARLATWGLAASCALDAGNVVLSAWLLLALNGNHPEHVHALEGIEDVLSIASLAALVFTATCVIAWLHRAYGNALAMGARSHWSQAWAIGSWFAPFMNLIVPYQIVAVLRRSAAALLGRQTGTALETTWWLTWLGGNLVGVVGNSMVASVHSIAQFTFGVTVVLAGTLLHLLAGLCAITIVRQATTMQQEAAGPHLARTFDGDAPVAPGDLPGSPSRLWLLAAEAAAAMTSAPAGKAHPPVADQAASPPPAPSTRRRDQVVGSPCDACGHPIRSALDLAACRSCGAYFHGRCAETPICLQCGGDGLARGMAAV